MKKIGIRINTKDTTIHTNWTDKTHRYFYDKDGENNGEKIGFEGCTK